MNKTLAGLATAAIMLVAACGDDSSDSSLGGLGAGGAGGSSANDDAGLGADGGSGASGDAGSFCDQFMNITDPSQAQGLNPPSEIASDWNAAAAGDPDAAARVGQWAVANCDMGAIGGFDTSGLDDVDLGDIDLGEFGN